ncbi:MULTISPECIES: OmcA/MtrC family decaheme c-type cytochrome [Pseudomonadati]|uniref:OmcA/MtrC family decaheme c-type cytochrome n=1 Tax=Shewanella aestuarii TaxID=1028752 RepID=A0ABT0L3A0_9GAMM|nr:OmcA/MtrC family decaheme c-type cytochrome [Shewanella aestuarii]MCL1118191.1 OmcA/MtrC family decaheme c-type cytochrome [Shewanella aestuarii]GGN81401.1 cytochrome c [Shewanella aestuarii]
MKRFNFNTTAKAVFSAGILSFVLAGCGSDGVDGPDGPDGPIGTPIKSATFIKSTITEAKVDDSKLLSLTFKLADAKGAAIFGLTQTDIATISFGRVGSATELGADDIINPNPERKIWLSYFNKDKGEGYFTGSSYFDGSKSTCTDCFTDNKDGSYSIKIDKAIDTLEKYDFVADATNGIYLSIKTTNDQSKTLVDNSFFYWVPATDVQVEKPLQILANSDCQTCHRAGQAGELSMHGSKHNTEEACSFCHTDYNRYSKQDKDADGNAIGEAYAFDGSIKGMVHSIHTTANLSSDGVYPQMTSNCLTCHNPNEDFNLTDSWKADVDTTACWSCHSPSPAAEAAGVKASHKQGANCFDCHGGEGRGRGAESAHYSLNSNNLASKIKVSFNSMSVAEDESSIAVNFFVKNGNDVVTLKQIDPRPYKYGGFNSAIVINGVLNDDFLVNYQKVGINHFVEQTDGSITATISSNDFKIKTLLDANSTIALSSQLHVCSRKGVIADCSTEDLDLNKQSAPYVTSDTYYFNVDGSKVDSSPRMQHAEMKDCQQCHTTEITHRYSNDLDGCASCHNGTRSNSNLAIKVHSKHYVYDSSGSLFFKKTECQACHGDEGFSIQGIKATASPVAFGKDTNGDLLVVSPQTAACVSCHVPPYGLSESTISHIENNGGVIGTIEKLGIPAADYDAMNVQEACSTCHTDNRILESHSNWGGH